MEIRREAIIFFTTPWDLSKNDHKYSLLEKIGITFLAILAIVVLGVVIPVITCWAIRSIMKIQPSSTEASSTEASSTEASTAEPPQTQTELKASFDEIVKLKYKNSGVVIRMLGQNNVLTGSSNSAKPPQEYMKYEMRMGDGYGNYLSATYIKEGIPIRNTPGAIGLIYDPDNLYIHHAFKFDGATRYGNARLTTSSENERERRYNGQKDYSRIGENQRTLYGIAHKVQRMFNKYIITGERSCLPWNEVTIGPSENCEKNPKEAIIGVICSESVCQDPEQMSQIRELIDSYKQGLSFYTYDFSKGALTAVPEQLPIL